MRIDLFEAGFWGRAAEFALYAVIASVVISISLFQISAAVFMACSLLHACFSKQGLVKRDAFNALLALFFVFTALSLFKTEYLWTSLRGLFKDLREILLCLCVVHALKSREAFGRAFYWLLIVGAAVAADALIQGTTGIELLRQRQMTVYTATVNRLTGPYHHANDFSAYLCFIVLVYVGFIAGEARSLSRGKLALLTAGLSALLLSLAGTYARGAWLASLATAALLAFFRRSRSLIAVLALTMVCAVFFSPPSMKHRWQTLWTARDGTVVERTELWGESMRMIEKSPWLGLGVNTYARNEPLFKAEGSKTDNQYAHNGYLHIAAETGLLGLGSFLAFLAYFIIASLRRFLTGTATFLKNAGTALVFGVVALLLHAMTDTDLQSVLLVNTLWLAVGFAWAAKRLDEQAHP